MASSPEKDAKIFALARNSGSGDGGKPQSDIARLTAIVEALADTIISLEARMDRQEVRPLNVDLRTIAKMVSDTVSAIPKPNDGKSVTVEDIAPFIAREVSAAVAAIKPAQDGVGIRDAFIDRSNALVLTLTDGSTRELGVVVGSNGNSPSKEDIAAAVAAYLQDHPPQKGDAGESVDPSEVQKAVAEAVAKIELPDHTDLLKTLVNDAIAALPKPENGRDAAHVEHIDINTDGNLIFSLSDGRKFNAGLARGRDGVSIKGDPGEPGRSVSLTEIDDKGRLCMHLSDGTIQVPGRVVGRDGADGQRGVQGEIGPTGPLPTEDELVRLITNVRQSAEIADAAAGLKTLALAVETAVQSMTAPKRIVRDKHGRPVGIEPALSPDEPA